MSIEAADKATGLMRAVGLFIAMMIAGGLGAVAAAQESGGEGGDGGGVVGDREREVGRIMDRVLPTLDEARELVDQHDALPTRTFVPFRSDQRSNDVAINQLLDEAIAMLDVSGLTDVRKRIRELRNGIAVSRTKIAEHQRKRISAVTRDELTLLDRANPFVTTREAYDVMIDTERRSIEAAEGELAELKKRFAEELRAIGLDVDDSAVDSLLGSVTGEEFVTMAVVFDNLRDMTEQLEKLTEQSGEALDVSKRYYGVYVVMVKVMDRLQRKFVDDVNRVHIPKLKEYARAAEENMADAERLIRNGEGDRRVLEQNIESNRVTQRTAELYVEHLKENAAVVEKENEDVGRTLATALNTYKTVKLSSDVAALMETGRQNFELLMRMRVPYLREFENAVIRREFERLTDRLRRDEG